MIFLLFSRRFSMWKYYIYILTTYSSQHVFYNYSFLDIYLCHTLSKITRRLNIVRIIICYVKYSLYDPNLANIPQMLHKYTTHIQFPTQIQKLLQDVKLKQKIYLLNNIVVLSIIIYYCLFYLPVSPYLQHFSLMFIACESLLTFITKHLNYELFISGAQYHCLGHNIFYYKRLLKCYAYSFNTYISNGS